MRVKRSLRRRLTNWRSERELRYVVILSGASADSSSLQEVLSSIDGYLIRGDDDGACRRLFELTATLEGRHRQFRRVNTKRPANRPDHAWFGMSNFESDAFVAACRRLLVDTLLVPQRGTRVLGFRALVDQVSDLDGYLAYLARLLPSVRFLVIGGDEAITASALGSPAPSLVTDGDGDVERSDELRRMLEFLGEPTPGCSRRMSRTHASSAGDTRSR